MNYLQWMSADTPTKFWHDSAIPDEIDRSMENGALGVTTNPVLTYKTLQAVPEFWQPQVDKIDPSLPPSARAEQLVRIVALYAAGKFRKIFDDTEGQHGYALCQLDPSICSDSEKMLEQGLKYASWADNICIKTPTIMSALPVVEELAARGIAVCTTVNFSVSQALAVGDAYMKGRARALRAGITPKPVFVVQQGGRLDEYLADTVRDSRLDVDPDTIAYAGNAVCKKVYRLFKERDIPAKVMPAGLRGVHHLTSMAGADMIFSMQYRVQQMVLQADPPHEKHIGDEIPDDAIARLRKIPEFVRAYDEGGLRPEEFLTFGVTQRTLTQFLWTGWIPLETYQTGGSQRWF